MTTTRIPRAPHLAYADDWPVASPPSTAAQRAARLMSGFIVALMIVSSVAGLWIDGVYQEPDAVAALPRGYDLTTLVFAAPLLAVALHQVAYLIALVFQANAQIPGASATDPGELPIAVAFLAGAGLLLANCGRRTAE